MDRPTKEEVDDAIKNHDSIGDGDGREAVLAAEVLALREDVAAQAAALDALKLWQSKRSARYSTEAVDELLHVIDILGDEYGMREVLDAARTVRDSMEPKRGA